MSTCRVLAALSLAACVLGCRPHAAAPPSVHACLRHQSGHATITLPAWDMDVAEEVAANAERYQGKTLVVQAAWLDPERPLVLNDKAALFPLRGGGVVSCPLDGVPAWLRRWTAAPLAFRARVHPPRSLREVPNLPEDGILLTGLSVDFAHPLELTCVRFQRDQDGAYVTAQVENFRGEPAAATLDLRFGPTRSSTKLDPVQPGQAATRRLFLFSGQEPAWRDLPAQDRSLALRFADGSALSVDIGKWLEAPPETLLDWGYSFTPPATALMPLSVDRPEAELERFAALELRSYLEQFTDANVEPREGDAPAEPRGGDAPAEPPPAGLPLLIVGTAAHNPTAAALLKENGLEARLPPLGPEGYLLKSLRHEGRPALLVAANTPRGLTQGVYGLLEHLGVRFTLHGASLPPRGPLRLPEVDEARAPVFARRRLVAWGTEPQETARWSQWRCRISLLDLAAKNRYNEVVVPLDGLDATFACEPGKTRDAVFPFDVGQYACLAEAAVAHANGLAILADYARRRGLDLLFAHRDAEGALCVAPPPPCVAAAVPARDVGQPVDFLADAGDSFALPRVEEAAQAGADLLRTKSATLSVPYARGSILRASFLAKLAWNPALTPRDYFHGWAATLCQGDAADKLADAVLALDKLDTDILAALPWPLGSGPALATPVQEADLACDWPKLRDRASQPALAQETQALKDQSKRLHELAAKLDPILEAIRSALGTVAPPWEQPLFESAAATDHAQRVLSGFQRFRDLLDGFGDAQEGALAYLAALADPEQALPRLLLAAGKLASARQRITERGRRGPGSAPDPAFATLAQQLAEQHRLLTDWLGPVADATAVARLRVQGSDAIVHLFRKQRTDLYVAYRLAGGREVLPLRLPCSSVRVIRRGQAPKTLAAEGGAFLIEIDNLPTTLIAPRAAWPGTP